MFRKNFLGIEIWSSKSQFDIKKKKGFVDPKDPEQTLLESENIIIKIPKKRNPENIF